MLNDVSKEVVESGKPDSVVLFMTRSQSGNTPSSIFDKVVGVLEWCSKDLMGEGCAAGMMFVSHAAKLGS